MGRVPVYVPVGRKEKINRLPWWPALFSDPARSRAQTRLPCSTISLISHARKLAFLSICMYIYIYGSLIRELIANIWATPFLAFDLFELRGNLVADLSTDCRATFVFEQSKHSSPIPLSNYRSNWSSIDIDNTRALVNNPPGICKKQLEKRMEKRERSVVSARIISTKMGNESDCTERRMCNFANRSCCSSARFK